MSAGGQFLITASQLRQLVTTKLQVTGCLSPSCCHQREQIVRQTSIIRLLVALLQELHTVHETQGHMLDELVERLNDLYRTVIQQVEKLKHVKVNNNGSISPTAAVSAQRPTNGLPPIGVRSTPNGLNSYGAVANNPLTNDLQLNNSMTNDQNTKLNGPMPNTQMPNGLKPPNIPQPKNLMANDPKANRPKTNNRKTNSPKANGPQMNDLPTNSLKPNNSKPNGQMTDGPITNSVLPAKADVVAGATVAANRKMSADDARGQLEKLLQTIIDNRSKNVDLATNNNNGQPVNATVGSSAKDSIAALKEVNGLLRPNANTTNKRPSDDGQSSSAKRPCAVQSSGVTALVEAGAPLCVGALTNGKPPVVIRQPFNGQLISPTLVIDQTAAAKDSAISLTTTTIVSTAKLTPVSLLDDDFRPTSKKSAKRPKSPLLQPKKIGSPNNKSSPITNGRLSTMSASPAVLLSPLAGNDGRYWSVSGERVALQPPNFSTNILQSTLNAEEAPRLNRIVIISDEAGKVEYRLNYEVKSLQQKIYVYYHLTSRVDDAWTLGQIFDSKLDGYLPLTMRFKDAKPGELLWVSFRTVRVEPLAIGDLVPPIVVPLDGGQRRVLRLHWDESGEYRRRIKASNHSATATPITPTSVVAATKGRALQSTAMNECGVMALAPAPPSVELIELD